ncbi:hypothetical protein ETD86_28270 [Nonomuraea turkmeniaca]|uniref:Uncharacterized protein n=1 Tax=Nonomuraea turkmeniaca TaxID=103838 RepID=A0A5S4FBD0_9ACTN|nr:hypothetical protein [Nonomuraea turkmeniaca]TMR14857.1 hypothetical protein ETD86_28270 [Nonomuraea turkmeniaca]
MTVLRHPDSFSSQPADMYDWSPHAPRSWLPTVIEASCCEEYVLCSEGAEFFVRRRTDDGLYQETARGRYARAAKAWNDLAAEHRHQERADPKTARDPWW